MFVATIVNNDLEIDVIGIFVDEVIAVRTIANELCNRGLVLGGNSISDQLQNQHDLVKICDENGDGGYISEWKWSISRIDKITGELVNIENYSIEGKEDEKEDKDELEYLEESDEDRTHRYLIAEEAREIDEEEREDRNLEKNKELFTKTSVSDKFYSFQYQAFETELRSLNSTSGKILDKKTDITETEKEALRYIIKRMKTVIANQQELKRRYIASFFQ
jgi:hypothetical protein